MNTRKLTIIPQPLPAPVGHGPINFEQDAIPLRGPAPHEQWVCGNCGALVAIGVQNLWLHRTFPGSEVFAKCRACGEYNDITPPRLPPYHLQGDLADRFRGLLSEATRARNELTPRYGRYGENDPRHAVADQLLRVTSSAFLNVVHARDNLTYEGWWVENSFGEAVKAGMVPHRPQDFIERPSARHRDGGRNRVG